MPSIRDFNIYKSFVVLASLGKMIEADHLMQQSILKRAIYRVANHLQKTLPTPLNPLFRGLLLDSPVPAILSTTYQNASFVSFSEDHDVGCWFARPNTFVAGTYMMLHPQATGWLATYTPTNVSEILFHWSWKDFLNQSSPNLYQITENLAQQNNVDLSEWMFQVHFNLKNQKEVMLKPGPTINLTPVDQAGCPAAPILDKKYRPRPDFVIAPSGLQSVGIAPQTKLYLTDIEFPSPSQACPVCGQAGIEVIYILDRANLRVYKCSQCGQNSFAIVSQNP